MERRALIVGIDDYQEFPLEGCERDARSMAAVLRFHENGDPNFFCREMLSMSGEVTASKLKTKLERLFDDAADVALFYFAGHGAKRPDGWHLVTQDGISENRGVPFAEVLDLIQRSEVKEKIVILDCCFSGGMGDITDDLAQLPKGVSILTSSGSHQPAEEQEGQGVFTSILIEGLQGAAADILGNVTISGLYYFASMLLNPWQQRPEFKANLSRVETVRKCGDKIDRAILRKLPLYFTHPDNPYPLSPAYDPELEPVDLQKQAIFAEFRALATVNLMVPIGTRYFFHAAKESKACGLTSSGKLYWKLAMNNRI